MWTVDDVSALESVPRPGTRTESEVVLVAVPRSSRTPRTGLAARAVPVLNSAPWLALAVGAVAAAVLPGPASGPADRVALVVTLVLVFGALVGRLLVAAAQQPARRLPLTFLAGAVALWAVGSASVSAGQAVGEVTFPAPGEVLCFASYLGMAAFLLLDLPRRAATTRSVWLEAGVICGAAVCLAALPLLTPLAGTFRGDALQLLLACLYPLINLVMAGAVLAQMVVRHRDASLSNGALVFGFAGVALADSTFLVGHSSAAYSTDLTYAALWGISFSLVVAGASARQRAVVGPPRTEARSAVLLAFAAGLAVLVLVLNPAGVVGWAVTVPAVATLVCAGARMMIALRDARGAAEALRLSLTDELTGLANRRALLAAVDGALVESRPFGVLLIDLDDFKDVNDGLGHTVGDEVLLTLSHRMRSAMDSRGLIARLGGDEFAMFLPGADEIELLEAAQRVREVVRDPLRVGGLDLSMEASVGVTVRDPADTAPIELLRRADIAMYQAKQTRCGVLLFDAAHDGLSQHRLRRGEELRYAITHGQLVMWYQPQVDARTGEVVAMEALIRWRHPTDGLLSPIAFLADARAAGLMPAVTEVVVTRVLTDARRWHEAGMTFRVAMNWAPPELVGGRLVGRLVELVAISGLPPERLLVEVTEDSFLNDPARAREALLELRRHGIQVSIDDYGSGFSSLSYLRDLPVQELKLDRSFVTPVAQDERSRMIVQTTAQMARAFGLRLVAEGVEDAEGSAELVPMGVDVLQGYHIARPMPADEVMAWVAAWQRRDAAGSRVPLVDASDA